MAQPFNWEVAPMVPEAPKVPLRRSRSLDRGLAEERRSGAAPSPPPSPRNRPAVPQVPLFPVRPPPPSPRFARIHPAMMTADAPPPLPVAGEYKNPPGFVAIPPAVGARMGGGRGAALPVAEAIPVAAPGPGAGAPLPVYLGQAPETPLDAYLEILHYTRNPPAIGEVDQKPTPHEEKLRSVLELVLGRSHESVKIKTLWNWKPKQYLMPEDRITTDHMIEEKIKYHIDPGECAHFLETLTNLRLRLGRSFAYETEFFARILNNPDARTHFAALVWATRWSTQSSAEGGWPNALHSRMVDEVRVAAVSFFLSKF